VVSGVPLALFWLGEDGEGDAAVALEDRCPHRGGPLSTGTVAGGEVSCPWHGVRISLASGEVVNAALFCLEGEASGSVRARAERPLRPAGQVARVRRFSLRLSGEDVLIDLDALS
jgi:nitrite reductase/ring-hydroxylating ferredoxin subunit